MIPMSDFVRIDIASEIKRLAPVLGKDNALMLEQAFLLGDEDAKKRVLEMIDTLKAAVFADKNLKDAVLIEPPSAEIARTGDINMGTVLYGKKKIYPFMLPSEMLLTHIGIFGSSGYGKTNVVHHLVRELSRKDIPILIFDFSKRNYRDLLLVPELRDRMQVFTVGRNVAPYKFNPLKPPAGVEISQWAKEFAEIFDHSYWLLGGGKHIILKALDKLYTNSKPFKSPQIRGLKYFIEELESDKNSARERNWIVTAERPLASLCFRDTGNIFDCEEGILPSSFFDSPKIIPSHFDYGRKALQSSIANADGKLFESPARSKITVLELDSLSTNDKTFFIEIMLQWLRDWLIVKNAREKLSGVIVIEEAHHILNREKSKRQGSESVIDLIFREVRELGMGMIYVDQHPSLISYPALGNTTTHIYMNLGLDTQHSSDIEDASSMLGLDYATEGKYLRELPVGHAFILCRKLAFPHPFLIEFTLVKLLKGAVTEDDIRVPETTEDRDPALKTIEEPTQDRGAVTPLDAVQATIEKSVPKPPEPRSPVLGAPKIAGSVEGLDVSEAGWKIIRVLGRFDASATSEIYKMLSMSGATFKQNAERLITLGLLGSREAKVFRQNAIFYFLTNRGAAAFGAKFSRPSQDIKADEQALRIEAFFRKQGWEIDRRASPWILSKDEKNVRLVFATSLERAMLEGLLSHNGAHFLAASENVKNALIQMAAKRSAEQGKPFMLSVATLQMLEAGEKFRKVGFA